MDSVTQAALGAAIGTAVMARERPVWQAALAGALIATLPDMDVFIEKGDPVRDMVLHRADTHALFWQTLATPLIAAVAALLTGSRALYARWCLLVLVCLVTHSLLDAMTVYGTRLALPFSDQPYGLGSLFIIDPAYTLALLLGLIATLLSRSPRRHRWNRYGLLASTLYAGWSIAAQAHVTAQVMAAPAAQDLAPEQVLVTPTPFNTLLWRVVLIHGEHYSEGFYSLFDPMTRGDIGIAFARHPRGLAIDAATRDFDSATLIREFSGGFYALSDDGRFAYITDLRMGQYPFFPFTFAFAEHGSEPLHAIVPRQVEQRIPLRTGLAWLWQRLLGRSEQVPRAG